MKWAETEDGFIARKDGSSKWISNELSRMLVHKWRSEEAGILVGVNTANIDNPSLNVRSWKGRDPVRIVLDPNQKFDVRELIKKISKNKTIVISTHILEEVEAVCTRAAIIAKGKLLFDDTPNKLQESGSGSLDDTFRKITLGENN